MSRRSGRRPSSARDLALVAVFAALIAVLGLPGALSPFGNAVPITLQTLGVMLAGSVLGWRRGALAVLVFLLLTVAGLPLLAGGRGGLAVLTGPSVGYLIGWPLGAAVTGWLVERRLPALPVWWGVVANALGGIVVVYAVGVPVQAAVLGTSTVVSVAIGALAFLPGDAVKVVVAAVVASAVHRGYPAASPLAERDRVPTRTR
ncbi:biotin transporter BioY [Angustibacter aerolatus]|uniref:Biotin transporter n=1 Tax=Angustibacter aerolatus TaxID=1162965 RepID=A0ABQ6J9W5_9ACTN|nr:biotin transporter BioY [Angustibacter aerolatus]GMA84972.1 BioY family transporter [Angustibacter aerolatus]